MGLLIQILRRTMNKKSRRNVLKGLAVGVPATWAKPVVDSVVLPAHANVSCGVGQECFPRLSGRQSFDWPGGQGPHDVTFYKSTGCGTDPWEITYLVVLAESQEIASNLLKCTATSLPIDTPLTEGCQFWECE
jgi:hypothetical protein